MKVCCRCKETKENTEFLRESRMKLGLTSACRVCLRKYYNSRKDKNNAYRRNYRRSRPLESKKQHLKYIYDLSYEDYEQINLNQQYKRQLCKLEKDLQVDHSHKTNKVRGLLCSDCNKDLGVIEKHKDKLMDFLRYIEERKNGVKEYYRLREVSTGTVA